MGFESYMLLFVVSFLIKSDLNSIQSKDLSTVSTKFTRSKIVFHLSDTLRKFSSSLATESKFSQLNVTCTCSHDCMGAAHSSIELWIHAFVIEFN